MAVSILRRDLHNYCGEVVPLVGEKNNSSEVADRLKEKISKQRYRMNCTLNDVKQFNKVFNWFNKSKKELVFILLNEEKCAASEQLNGLPFPQEGAVLPSCEHVDLYSKLREVNIAYREVVKKHLLSLEGRSQN